MAEEEHPWWKRAPGEPEVPWGTSTNFEAQDPYDFATDTTGDNNVRAAWAAAGLGSMFVPFPGVAGAAAAGGHLVRGAVGAGALRMPTIAGWMGGRSIAGAVGAGVKKGVEVGYQITGRSLDRIPESLWTNTMKMHSKLAQKHPNLNLKKWQERVPTNQVQPAKAVKEARADQFSKSLGDDALMSENVVSQINKPAGLFDLPHWGYLTQWRVSTQNAFRRKVAEKMGMPNPSKNAHRVQRQPEAAQAGPSTRTFPWFTGREFADILRSSVPYSVGIGIADVAQKGEKLYRDAKEALADRDYPDQEHTEEFYDNMTMGGRSAANNERLLNHYDDYGRIMDYARSQGGLGRQDIQDWEQNTGYDFDEFMHSAEVGIERSGMRYYDVDQRVLDEGILHPAFANTESYNFDYAKDYMDELNHLMSPENPDYQSRMSAFQHNVGDTELQNKINSMNRRIRDMETMARLSPAQFRQTYASSASPEQWSEALWEMPDYAWRTQ